MRVRKDSTNPVYSERVMLKQVEPFIPDLLKESFGGYLRIEKPYSENSKPLWSWQTTDKNAARCCEAVLPYLRVKRRQAELLLELRKSKDPIYSMASYWFRLDFPNWQDLEMITGSEAANLLGHKHPTSLSQAIRNGSLLALPGVKGKEIPRFPKELVLRLKAGMSKGGRPCRPHQLIEWRESLFGQIKELNKIGVNGTSVYFLTGYHTPGDHETDGNAE